MLATEVGELKIRVENQIKMCLRVGAKIIKLQSILSVKNPGVKFRSPVFSQML